MRIQIKKGLAMGRVRVPCSKSAAHRHILAASLADGISVLGGVQLNEDISATLDCVRALGASVRIEGEKMIIHGVGRKDSENAVLPMLNCRESGSTMRFLIPVALLFGGGMFRGSERLITRGIGIYEDLFAASCKIGIGEKEITVKGRLEAGNYRLRGDVSSQFITGLMFALPLLERDSLIEIVPPFESRGYVDMTIDTLGRFGIEIERRGENMFFVRGGQRYLPVEADVEGDWSQAAFFYGLRALGGNVQVDGLDMHSLQGDRVCVSLFERLKQGYTEIDISDCPDLGPILFAVASALHGAHFTGTKRLAIKESNRAVVMAEELSKFGASVTVMENSVEIMPCALHAPSEPLEGHGDHRIVMALAVLATLFGADIEGAEAIGKSYPAFFDDLGRIGLKIKYYDA